MPILEVKNLKKIYTSRFGGNSVQALSNVSFSVEKGEYVAIMGESGSGKTTLLNILASLDKPSSGQVLLNGRNIVDIKEKEISAATISASCFRILICSTPFLFRTIFSCRWCSQVRSTTR